MSALSWLAPTAIFVEITPRTLYLLHEGTVRAWPLERNDVGYLTKDCFTRIRTDLPAAIGRRVWQPRVEARCALPASGVSLRRWKLPRASDDELQRLLVLQIENEFPLSPEELAWGWLRLGEIGNGQEILVAAVKRDAIAQYATLLEGCGLKPSFTLAALARRALQPPGSVGETQLDLGPDQSEWLLADALGPLRLRALPWGERTIVRDLGTDLGMIHDKAEAVVEQLVEGAANGDPAPEIQRIIERSVEGLASLLPSNGAAGRLHLTGRLATSPVVNATLGRSFGPANVCEPPDVGSAQGASAALRGLERLTRQGSPGAMLQLRTASAETPGILVRPAARTWAVVAGVLLLVLLTMPYLEALLLRPRLAARVAAIKSRQDRLAVIDRESDFLRYLKQNQTPYLEALHVLGRSVPPGSRVDALNLNRKGELSMRISMRQPQEVTDFRSKLADSGFFSSVVIEEQTPTPDRQQVLVRLSGQVKPAGARQGLKIFAADATPSPQPGPSPSGAGPPSRPGS